MIQKKSIDNLEEEIDTFRRALAVVKNQIREVKQKMAQQLSENELDIYDAHISILDDPELIDKTIDLITIQKVCADFAINVVAREYIELLEQLDDEYLSARAKDIDEVSSAVVKSIQGKSNQAIELTKPVIIVADKISTHQISVLETRFVLGIITAQGGATDHSSILYNAMGIPAIVGVGSQLNTVQYFNSIILDAEQGLIRIDPDPETLKAFEAQYESHRVEEKINLQSSHLPARTASGKHIKVFANIGNAKEAKEAQLRGADGVGLLRTEFCFLDRKTLPSEDEQYEMYKQMLDELPGKEVIIRLIDIGSDKMVSYIEMDEEENPALGIRALRLGFKHYDSLLRPQIRALLRLSAAFDIQLLFPMIATQQGLKDIKEAIHKEMIILKTEGVAVNTSIPMGIMVEIPNVALMPELFVDDVDFFSFGTNDLAQYMMAADRTNTSVASYLPKAIPGILKLIEKVTEIAHDRGKWVGICGGLAADTKLIETFIGFGVDELSMPSALIPKTKAFIRELE